MKSACLKNPYHLFSFERYSIRVLFMVSLVLTSCCLTLVQKGATAWHPHIALPVFYVVVPVPIRYQLNKTLRLSTAEGEAVGVDGDMSRSK